ncbi:hypothetical protein AYI69_g8315 [Smittium culicis]|uniref:Hexosyltransferase n=1 Tax=Smittium culicis TaxID=133412 RepID=A0A1R1XKI2_9FUNG|nr:hypothetical protein AYI69_g8315 [Smittium culicis]
MSFMSKSISILNQRFIQITNHVKEIEMLELKHEFETKKSAKNELFTKTSSKIFGLRTFYSSLYSSNFVKPYKKVRESLLELSRDVLIIVPIGKLDDPEWIKNVYSDLNVITVCDNDDSREICDVKLPRNYTYKQLPKKTFDTLNLICGSEKQYKVFMKMDFDIFIDKSYMYEVLEFMLENQFSRVYFGDPMEEEREYKGVAMNGKVYAVTSKIVSDYCSCNNRDPDEGYEDSWFGYVIGRCVLKQNLALKDQTIHLHSKEQLIYHKNYINDSVNLFIGRKNPEFLLQNNTDTESN